MDRLDSMSIFLAVVDAGSFSGASRRLATPLATVSRRISDLEAYLKVQLLTRSTRHLSMTDAGRAYAAACRRILDDVGEAERVASGEYRAPRGDLVIAAPIVFGRLHVLPVVLEFLRIYPEIDIRLVLADGIADVRDEHLDLAVRIGALPDSSLVAIRVGAIRRVVCASPVYFAERGIPQRPSDISAHDCVAFQGVMLPHAWTFSVAGADESVGIHSRLIVTTAEAAIDAAVAGIGITRLLSYQVAQPLRNGSLALALEAFEPAPSPISLVYAPQRLLTQKLRVFVDFATPRLKAVLMY